MVAVLVFVCYHLLGAGYVFESVCCVFYFAEIVCVGHVQQGSE